MKAKYLILIVLSIFAWTTFAEAKVEVRLPEWFMKPSTNSFVGISLPGEPKEYAISLALLQMLIAQDFEGEEKDALSSISSYGDGEDFKSSEFLQTIAVDLTLHYTILDTVKLPSGEYICRLSMGKEQSCSLQSIMKKYENFNQSGESMSYSSKLEFFFQMDETKLITRIYESMNQEDLSKDSEIKYEIQSLYEAPHKRFLFASSEDDFDETYIFPQKAVRYPSNIAHERFSVDGKRNLYSLLLPAYLNILSKGFVEEGASTLQPGEAKVLHTHKATPIIGFSYNDKVFDIHFESVY